MASVKDNCLEFRYPKYSNYCLAIWNPCSALQREVDALAMAGMLVESPKVQPTDCGHFFPLFEGMKSLTSFYSPCFDLDPTALLNKSSQTNKINSLDSNDSNKHYNYS